MYAECLARPDCLYCASGAGSCMRGDASRRVALDESGSLVDNCTVPLRAAQRPSEYVPSAQDLASYAGDVSFAAAELARSDAAPTGNLDFYDSHVRLLAHPEQSSFRMACTNCSADTDSWTASPSVGTTLGNLDRYWIDSAAMPNEELLSVNRWVDPTHAQRVYGHKLLFADLEMSNTAAHGYYFSLTIIPGVADRKGFGVVFGYKDPTQQASYSLDLRHYSLEWGVQLDGLAGRPAECPAPSLDAGLIRLYRYVDGVQTLLYSHPYTYGPPITVLVMVRPRAAGTEITVMQREQGVAASPPPAGAARSPFLFTYRDLNTTRVLGGMVGVAQLGNPGTIFSRMRLGLLSSPLSTPSFPGLFRVPLPPAAPLVRSIVARSLEPLVPGQNTPTIYYAHGCGTSKTFTVGIAHQSPAGSILTYSRSATGLGQSALTVPLPGAVIGFRTDCNMGGLIAAPYTWTSADPSRFGVFTSTTVRRPSTAAASGWLCRPRDHTQSLTDLSFLLRGASPRLFAPAAGGIADAGLRVGPVDATTEVITNVAFSSVGVDCMYTVPTVHETVRMWAGYARPSPTPGIPPVPNARLGFAPLSVLGAPGYVTNNVAHDHRYQIIHLTGAAANSSLWVNVHDATYSRTPSVQVETVETYAANSIPFLVQRVDPRGGSVSASTYPAELSVPLPTSGVTLVRLASHGHMLRRLEIHLIARGWASQEQKPAGLFCTVGFGAVPSAVNGVGEEGYTKEKTVFSEVLAAACKSAVNSTDGQSMRAFLELNDRTPFMILPDLYLLIWHPPIGLSTIYPSPSGAPYVQVIPYSTDTPSVCHYYPSIVPIAGGSLNFVVLEAGASATAAYLTGEGSKLPAVAVNFSVTLQPLQTVLNLLSSGAGLSSSDITYTSTVASVAVHTVALPPGIGTRLEVVMTIGGINRTMQDGIAYVL